VRRHTELAEAGRVIGARTTRSRDDLAKKCDVARIEPDRTAKDLYDRLREERPGEFSDGQLRTLQRRVKEWRRLAVRRLVRQLRLATVPLRRSRLGNKPT
jgi:hypothetical protein